MKWAWHVLHYRGMKTVRDRAEFVLYFLVAALLFASIAAACHWKFGS